MDEDLRDERRRRPLIVRRTEPDISEVHLLGRWVEAAIIFDYQRHLSTGLFDRSDDVNDVEFDAIVRAELDHYPTAESWQFNRRGGVRTDFRTFDTWEVQVAWQAADQSVGSRNYGAEIRVPEHHVRDQR